jgi:3-oxoacyl-[acyl-carrier protein] reductase
LDLELQNKRVVVTGSSSGIGLGIARHFVRHGSRVVITGRDAARLAGICDASQSVGALSSAAVDLTTEQGVGELATTVMKQLDGLDVLVLNIGSGRSVSFADAEWVEWVRVLELNLISALQTLRVLTPILLQGRDPAVCFIGSIAGSEATVAPIAYGAAKAGLSHAMKVAARELAPQGIRVNMVSPGNVLSAGGTWDRKQQSDPAGVAEMLQRAVPLRRFATVEEIAVAVLFLCSRLSSFTVGANLIVDGGQTVVV